MKLLILSILLTALPGGIKAGGPKIDVQSKVWGKGSVADIHAVLASAQTEIWKHCDGLTAPDIKVVYRRECPITFDRHLPDGRVRIGLATKDMYWSQYSFQYAHEFAHVIAGHVLPKGKWTGADNAVGWLEESLCEAASLFALRAMAATWREKPPYPNWKGYASALATYAENRLTDPHHQLPEGMNFASWLQDHLLELQTNCCNRAWNTLIAAQLLPIFEADPAAWKALAYFRLSPAGPDAQLDAHMAGWRDACPEELKGHVVRMGEILGVRLP